MVYRHRQLRAQLDLVRTVCDLRPGARLVAAFPPFALYGPALGVAAAVPDMDPTKPGTLTATALAEAVAAVEATVVFASPAALRNVAATAADLTPELRRHLGGVRTLLSAGAPVPVPLLREIQALLPNAELHTPYGMTEALPATDITLDEIEQALADAGPEADGVCVGRPLPGVRLALDPPRRDGPPDRRPRDRVRRDGRDLCGRRPREGPLRPAVEHPAAQRDPGRLASHRRRRSPGRRRDGCGWRAGSVHVITGPAGPVTPVGIEQRVEAVPDVGLAAAVGVGPAGTQQTVVVLATGQPGRAAGRPATSRPPSGPPPAYPSPPCWSPTGCRSTSDMPPRSTGYGWPAGPSTSSPAAGRAAGSARP